MFQNVLFHKNAKTIFKLKNLYENFFFFQNNYSHWNKREKGYENQYTQDMIGKPCNLLTVGTNANLFQNCEFVSNRIFFKNFKKFGTRKFFRWYTWQILPQIWAWFPRTNLDIYLCWFVLCSGRGSFLFVFTRWRRCCILYLMQGWSLKITTLRTHQSPVLETRQDVGIVRSLKIHLIKIYFYLFFCFKNYNQLIEYFNYHQYTNYWLQYIYDQLDIII